MVEYPVQNDQLHLLRGKVIDRIRQLGQVFFQVLRLVHEGNLQILSASLAMNEPMLLPVDHNGEELEFEMKIQSGYVPRAEIIIDGIPLIFEPDNEGRYRAIQIDQSKKLDTNLLQAISAQLEILFN